MKLKCQQCGTEKEFLSHKEAYQDGWDFPPVCAVTTCGDCPSAPLVLKKLNTLKGLDFGKGLLDVGSQVPPLTVRSPNPPHKYKKP